RESNARREPVASSFLAGDESLVRIAETSGGPDQRIEHALKIEGRSADDLEHVGGRGLLLQRLSEVVRALAQFVEQPRILDGDNGLSGEVRYQLDLLVGERPHLLAVNADHS